MIVYSMHASARASCVGHDFLQGSVGASQVANAWKREKKIKAKKRVAPGQGIPLSPSLNASEGMMQALNGTTPRPASESVSRKQLTKMLAQVGNWSKVQVLPCYLSA